MSTAAAAQPTASTGTATFEPRLTAFVCKWCTYAGADLAGTSRMTYPPNMRVIKLPCTGRIDIVFILRAFLQGADGVLVSGCHPGDCHYTAGNYRARRRWALFRDLLDFTGFDLRRFDCAWISAAEGAKWARTVAEFTEKIRGLGPYREMRDLTAERAPDLAFAAPAPVRAEAVAAVASPELSAAAREALASGKVKAVVGWVASATLGRPRFHWITRPEEADQLRLCSGASSNLARALKNPALRSLRPLGMVVRAAEMRALNVLQQEAQIAPGDVVLFTVGADGKFQGVLDADAAAKALLGTASDRLAGVSDETLRALDEISALPREKRWAFWKAQFDRCIKCYACRGSCPMCGCEQCLADRNQPQWWSTAADSAGSFAWNVVRAFHLAGRCVGCGSCRAACPSGVAIDVLGAAVARSAQKNFGHRAGEDPTAAPLQADWKPDDRECFIL